MAEIEVILEVGATVEADIVSTGRPGKGVAPGGAVGEVLLKASDTDYDTEWGNIQATDDGAGNVTIYLGVN